MKKLLVVAVALALALPAITASASTYTASFAPGKYTGTIKSVIPDLNGKPATLEIKQLGSKVVATAEFAGSKEVWTWDDTTLDQQEINPTTSATVANYKALAAGTPQGAKQTFNINCTDKTKNVCDAGADFRNYWVLEGTPTNFTYTVYGVDPAKKTDTALKAVERHKFVFNKAK